MAFEANPDTFRRLSERKLDRVHFLNYAISDIQGELEFVEGAVSHVFTTIDKQNSYSISGETVKVQSRTLDSLIGTDNSIILKIDVEGQEINVLKGAEQLLASGAIRVVYLDGYEDASINDMLIQHGFNLHDGRTLKRVEGKVFSLLAIKRAKSGSGGNG